MPIRKLILYCFTLVLFSLLLAEAKTAKPSNYRSSGKPSKIKGAGKPSKFNPNRHSKPKKQKSGFKKNRGGIKH